MISKERVPEETTLGKRVLRQAAYSTIGLPFNPGETISTTVDNVASLPGISHLISGAAETADWVSGRRISGKRERSIKLDGGFETRTRSEIMAILEGEEIPDDLKELFEQFQGKTKNACDYVTSELDSWMTSVGMQQPGLKKRFEQGRRMTTQRFGNALKWGANVFFYAYLTTFCESPLGVEEVDAFVEFLNTYVDSLPLAVKRACYMFSVLVPSRGVSGFEVDSPSSVYGAMTVLLSFYAIFRRKLAWRPDQVILDKEWEGRRNNDLKEGRRNYGSPETILDDNETKANHTIVFGLDPILGVDGESWEGSYLHALRQETEQSSGDLGDVVIAQREKPKDREERGVFDVDENGDENMRVYLSAMRSAQRIKWFRPILSMGLHKAARVQINMQRQFDLFDTSCVGNEKGNQPSWDLGTIQHMLENAMIIRKILFKKAPPLEVQMVMPRFLKAGENAPDESTPYTRVYKYWLKKLERIEGVKVCKPIVPENEYMKELGSIVKRRGVADPKIHIDVAGQQNQETKIENMIRALEGDPHMNFASDSMEFDTPAKEANVWVVLRTHNNNLDGETSSMLEQAEWDLAEESQHFIVYTSNASVDPVDHENQDESDQRRRNIPLRSRIASILLKQIRDNKKAKNSTVA